MSVSPQALPPHVPPPHRPCRRTLHRSRTPHARCTRWGTPAHQCSHKLLVVTVCCLCVACVLHVGCYVILACAITLMAQLGPVVPSGHKQVPLAHTPGPHPPTWTQVASCRPQQGVIQHVTRAVTCIALDPIRCACAAPDMLCQSTQPHRSMWCRCSCLCPSNPVDNPRSRGVC